MEKMIQALFNSESEAFTGLQLIQQLAVAQDISLGESYILTKDAEGRTLLRSAKDEAEGYTAIGGGIIGGLIGLLAGPLGFLVGIGAGMIAGAAGDTVRAEGVSDYLDRVTENVPNGKSVLVAHVWEDDEDKLDAVLLPLTADVYRMNINDEVFVPAKTELEKINDEVTEAETHYLGAEDDDAKHEWNEKMLLLKIKREHFLDKLHGKDTHQENQYEKWLDNHQEHFHHIDKAVHDKERHDKLQSRITEQQTRLAQLRQNR